MLQKQLIDVEEEGGQLGLLPSGQLTATGGPTFTILQSQEKSQMNQNYNMINTVTIR